MMIRDAAYWIEKLKLEPHPEGGHYRQTYCAELMLPKDSLPQEFSGARAASTAIYFLLQGEEFSAFHRLQSDEVWHFYLGDALAVQMIDATGEHSEIFLGNDPDVGEVLQAVVKAGCWFGSSLRRARMPQGCGFALVGCTVAPGFDFEDFEMGRRRELAQSYPQHRGLIERLTRG
jgi:predicted cupin superfamily sugar epimerase